MKVGFDMKIAVQTSPPHRPTHRNSVQFRTLTKQHLRKMGPKKNKSDKKSSLKSEKCQYFDRGFCNKANECSKVHPEKVCDDPDCFDDSCEKRHPNPCKYGNRCRFNMRNICMYSHVTFASVDGNLNALENKFNKRIEALENLCKEKQKNMEKVISEKEKK